MPRGPRNRRHLARHRGSRRPRSRISIWHAIRGAKTTLLPRSRRSARTHPSPSKSGEFWGERYAERDPDIRRSEFECRSGHRSRYAVDYPRRVRGLYHCYGESPARDGYGIRYHGCHGEGRDYQEGPAKGVVEVGRGSNSEVVLSMR